MIIFSEKKRCQHPHFTQFFKKQKRCRQKRDWLASTKREGHHQIEAIDYRTVCDRDEEKKDLQRRLEMNKIGFDTTENKPSEGLMTIFEVLLLLTCSPVTKEYE